MSLLYLEDYLEMIEHLPQEMADKLTTVRELDLQVHNSLDKVETQINGFFDNIHNLKDEEIDAEHKNILNEYDKNLEDSDEKISIAQNMTEYIGKYMRRLEQDLMRFKMELESDNPGCTEIIDRRVEEQRGKTSASLYHVQNSVKRGTGRRHHSYENPLHEQNLKEGKLNEHVVEPKYSQISLPSVPSTSTTVFAMDQMSPGGSAIAAAASQAIVATQQMQQGRRTASLKASFEAINSVVVPTTSFAKTVSSDASVNKELAGAAETAVAATQERRKKRRRKKRGGSSVTTEQQPDSPSASGASSQAEVMEDDSAELDPNEPRYCICNEVAFGNMVACDNKSCTYEWYHYACVGMTDPPKGKWYCPQCVTTMKKRSYRKHT